MSTISVSDRIAHSSARARAARSTSRPRPVLLRGVTLLAALDSIAAVVAIVVVVVSLNFPDIPGSLDRFLSARVTVKNILLLNLLATAWPAVFHIFGLYEVRSVRRFGSEILRLVGATFVGSGLALAFPLTSVSGKVTVAAMPRFWLVSLGLCLAIRLARRAVDPAPDRHVRRALIVGTGRLAERAHREIHLDRAHRYEVVGFIDEPANGQPDYDRVSEPVMGTLDDLEQILMHDVIDEVVIALPVKSYYQQIQHAIGVCERAGVQAKYGADMFHSTVAFPRYDGRGDRAVVAMQVAPDGSQLVVKRAIDIIGAAAALILLAPVMAIVGALIWLTSPGPIIYAQARCGLNKRLFRMYKFRSMRADAETIQPALEERNEARGPVFKIRDDPRITPLGRVLRKSSIDELPQLWNVLKGDMSLVGPRPLPWRDVRRITRPSDMRRFSMRPGLTCLWQVQGRSNIDFERWVALDLEYIDKWSLALDLWLLVLTIPAVVRGEGAT
jgi:exopolysaccharide biosynthesis polyprenyl glycosylphosphotransferase